MEGKGAGCDHAIECSESKHEAATSQLACLSLGSVREKTIEWRLPVSSCSCFSREKEKNWAPVNDRLVTCDAALEETAGLRWVEIRRSGFKGGERSGGRGGGCDACCRANGGGMEMPAERFGRETWDGGVRGEVTKARHHCEGRGSPSHEERKCRSRVRSPRLWAACHQ